MEDGTALRRTLGVSGFEKERKQVLEVRHEARLREVRLDPDGALPMVNGPHPLIRRAALLALDRTARTGSSSTSRRPTSRGSRTTSTCASSSGAGSS